MNTRQKGNKGEELAAEYLQQQGMEILRRNYYGPSGEVDIIAREGAVVAFVEVKTRAHDTFAHPIEAITPKKQERIRLTAQQWLAEEGYEGFCRFDAVEVLVKPGKAPVITYWRNAF